MAAKTTSRKQGNLFEDVHDTGGWKPRSLDTLPNLTGVKRIWVDNETTGNDKRNDKVCGFTVATMDDSFYLPISHEEGGNLDKDQVLAWCKANFRGKTVSNINTGFDAETSRNTGLDWEELDVKLHDISHAQALINERQFKGMSLNDLSWLYFKKKKDEVNVKPENYHKVHSSLIGTYAEKDVALARDIDVAQQPMLKHDRLERVMALEDELIWANNHMERNGSRMDMPLLTAWNQGLKDEIAGLTMDIWDKTGIRLRPNSPDSWGEVMVKLGRKKNVVRTELKERQRKSCKVSQLITYSKEIQSYDEEVLLGYLKDSQDPVIKKGLRIRRLLSLQSKFVEKYFKAQKNGVLYWNLYQLRADEEAYGTVVGRYSSANVNIQQVYKPGNQAEKLCDCGATKEQKEDNVHHGDCLGLKYIIRQMMIPDDGFDLFAVDGSQLQFRLFAHYSEDKQLIDRYKFDPDVDFHQMVADLFEMKRQAAKHNNFAMVLGMGREKLANRVGKPCTCQEEEYWSREVRNKMFTPDGKKDFGARRERIFGIDENHASRCQARESNAMADDYERKFPAAKSTMEKVTKTCEERGYIMTPLGRRTRFIIDGEVVNHKFYSGFAALLQGGEADVVKSKINTLYRERKVLGIHKLRQPVHDEQVGDIDKDPNKKSLFEECCRDQEIELKVPILWEAKYGPNWKDMKQLKSKKSTVTVVDLKQSEPWMTKGYSHAKGADINK